MSQQKHTEEVVAQIEKYLARVNSPLSKVKQQSAFDWNYILVQDFGYLSNTISDPVPALMRMISHCYFWLYAMPMRHYPDFATALTDERQRQELKWGEQNHSDFIWLAILNEEGGEVSQEVLRVHFGKISSENLATELVQTASVCVAWIECIKRAKGE